MSDIRELSPKDYRHDRIELLVDESARSQLATSIALEPEPDRLPASEQQSGQPRAWVASRCVALATGDRMRRAATVWALDSGLAVRPCDGPAQVASTISEGADLLVVQPGPIERAAVLALMRRLRAGGFRGPILYATADSSGAARDREHEIRQAFEAGATAALAGASAARLLPAQARALLDLAPPQDPPRPRTRCRLRLEGNIVYSDGRMRPRVCGTKLEILRHLVALEGKPASRREICEQVLGQRATGSTSADHHMSALRRLLDDDDDDSGAPGALEASARRRRDGPSTHSDAATRRESHKRDKAPERERGIRHAYRSVTSVIQTSSGAGWFIPVDFVCTCERRCASCG